MNCFIRETLKFIYLKRKQIIFALFAFVCIILDNNDSITILKSAAPAVVAAAAAAGGSGAAAGGGVAAGGVVASGSATAGGVAASSSSATTSSALGSTAGTMKKSKDGMDAFSKVQTSSNFSSTNIPKNTNPKGFGTSNLETDMSKSRGNLNDSFSDNMSAKKNAGNNLTHTENSGYHGRGSSAISGSGESEEEEEEDDDDGLIENVSDDLLKISPGAIFGCSIIAIMVVILFIPAMLLSVFNASSSTMTQLDCSMQGGILCEEEEASFFDKIKNLFKYGSYGSNTQVVLTKFEETYNKILEEYDFIISMPLLTSTMFGDSEYIKTDVENGNIGITDEMLERIEYMYDTAMLQLIPRYHIFDCIASEDEHGNVSYTSSYKYTLEMEQEKEAELIQTGTCDASTAGGIYKEIEYYYDEEKYFKRLMDSEELDLIYYKFNDTDKLLIQKIGNQYYLYKKFYGNSAELSYGNVPSYLSTDSAVSMQSPIKGWYSVTSPFGMRTGEYAGMHTGIDVVSDDKNIYSAGIGVVTRSDVEKEGGNVIEITHTDSSGKKYVTQYAHLSERLVNVGDTVNSGDVIAIMGDTGTMASGVHLHFSAWEESTKKYLNPRKLFNDSGN